MDRKKIVEVGRNWRIDGKAQLYDDFYVCFECQKLFKEENKFYLHNNGKHKEVALEVDEKDNEDDVSDETNDTDDETYSSTSNTKSTLTIRNMEIHAKRIPKITSAMKSMIIEKSQQANFFCFQCAKSFEFKNLYEQHIKLHLAAPKIKRSKMKSKKQ